MGPRLPALDTRLGLGVGLDLPWGAAIGFVDDAVTDRVPRFLHAHAFSHLFVSWQPKDRNRLDARSYFAAYDDLFARTPPYAARALHQTAFNLGALEHYDRVPIVELTNALAERYDLAWVNEDLGLWSIHGRPLPYPLPPYLTDAGLAAAIRNTDEVQRALVVPLLVEFPGFSQGTNVVIGRWHAFDFFRRVVEDTGSPCTLDLGHLLSYQWLRGKRGEALYDDLDRLPLDHCFEIHLSGCEISNGQFFDYHHGVLIDEQLELLARIAPRCTKLRAITYEDPKFDDDGVLTAPATPGVDLLRAWVHGWQSAPGASESASSRVSAPGLDEESTNACIELPRQGGRESMSVDLALDRLLHDATYRTAFLAGAFLDLAPADLDALHCIDPIELATAADLVRGDVLTRGHRGSGDLTALFPGTIASWQPEHLDRFLASETYAAYRELPFAGEGTCLEEAFYRFCAAENIGDAVTREHEFLGAMLRALAISPEPAFALPPEIRRVEGGYLAISLREVPTLFLAAHGRLIAGELTPFLAELILHPRDADAIAIRHGVEPRVLDEAQRQLATLFAF